MAPFYIDDFPGHNEIVAIHLKRREIDERGGITTCEVIDKTIMLLDIVNRRF